MFKTLIATNLFSAILFLVTSGPVYNRFAAEKPTLFPSVVDIQNKGDAKVGEVTLEAGKSVTAAIGKKCIVEVKTTAKKVTWKVPPELDFVILTPNSIGIWGVPGTYTVAAMVPSGDDVLSTEISVSITGDVPNVVPNAFIVELKAAYAKDGGAAKAVLLGKLAALYRYTGTGKDAAGKDIGVNDPTIKTYHDLHLDFATANAAQMAQTDLQNVRTVIAKRLDANLSTLVSAPIDRKLAASEYLAVAAALETIAK